MKKPTEIEFKYRADDIDLTAFIAFCQEREPVKIVNAAGYDHFYQNIKDLDVFCRHRIGPDMNQLTFKRKTTDSNNFIRTEHNIDLLSASREQIASLASEFGYIHNFSLYKNCFIYCYDLYTLVYYIVYDEAMKESGRFVEIEMKEDYPWSSEQEAWEQLLVFEKLCKPLGLSAQSRIKRSLFELYRK